MSYKPCPQSNVECRYFESELGCVTNLHHEYWPRKRYTSGVESTFRNLPQNKVEMCMAEHRELHATTKPPQKPSRDEMLQAIAFRAIEEAS